MATAGELMFVFITSLFLIIAGGICLDAELNRRDQLEKVRVITGIEIAIGCIGILLVAYMSYNKFKGD